MFFENYISEPLKYGFSDFSKLLKGGIFYGISIFLLIFGIYLALYPFIGMNAPFFSPANSLLFGLIALLTSLTGTVLLITLNGYIVRMIKLSLEKSVELPEWNSYWTMFKSGFVFTLGISVIAVFESILQNVIQYIGNGETAVIIILMLIQLIISLYIPLSAVNYIKMGNFGAFFDVPKIFKIMSLEYVGAFLVISIVSVLLVIIPTILVVLALVLIFNIGGFAGPRMLFTTTPVLLIIFILAFAIFSIVAFYVSIYSYRAYTNYFISKLKTDEY
ncbi:DUF4013 domain-containing protein [Methanococcus sp. CF]